MIIINALQGKAQAMDFISTYRQTRFRRYGQMAKSFKMNIAPFPKGTGSDIQRSFGMKIISSLIPH